MLKIKDDFDLNELRKFGFMKMGIRDEYVYELDLLHPDTKGNGVDIFISGDRKITIQSHFGYNEYRRTYAYNCDILFDLIQAGIVEKVAK